MPAEIRAFVGAGSNLGQPRAQLEAAVARVDATPGCRVSRVSPWYCSTAIGPGRQDDYVNGVLELLTTLPALELLDALQAIENDAGRVRQLRWGPRTLDLDILLYGDLVLDMERLQVPHPRMKERNFVIAPLCDLAPALVLPGALPIAQLRRQLGGRGLRLLDAAPGESGVGRS